MGWEILLTLSIRFFLFDFVLFRKVRVFLKKGGYVFRKLLSCPFCQGFWCGLAVYLASHMPMLSWQYLLTMLSFSFSTAYLGLLSAALFYPVIEKYEDKAYPLVGSDHDPGPKR